jgi:hypothetical protein
MDAPLSLRRSWIATRPPLAALLRSITAAVVTLLALAAAVVWTRRAAGAIVAPLPAEALLAAGAALALAVAAFRVAWCARSCADRDSDARNGRYVLWSVPTLVVVLAAAALSVPGSAPPGLLGLWILAVLEEGWAWHRLFSQAAVISALPGAAGASPARASLEGVSAIPHWRDASATQLPATGVTQSLQQIEPDTTHPLDSPEEENVSQYLVRRRADEGETLDGWTRVQFDPAQRHASAHVAICPPFARTPQCFAEIADGTEGDVKVGQVLAYGVRFDIKLDKPATEPASVTIEFLIQEHVADEEPG